MSRGIQGAKRCILSNRDDDFSHVKCTVRVPTIFSSLLRDHFHPQFSIIVSLTKNFSSFSVVQNKQTRPRSLVLADFKQLLDEVLLISGII